MSKSNPKQNKAVALRYDADKDRTPIVVASGCGEVAQNIIKIAEKNGIPVFRDDIVASLLCMLKVGTSIPPELYEVIATIYVSLLQSSDKLRKKVMNDNGGNNQ